MCGLSAARWLRSLTLRSTGLARRGRGTRSMRGSAGRCTGTSSDLHWHRVRRKAGTTLRWVTVDFAVSDIGYQGVDTRTDRNDTSSTGPMRSCRLSPAAPRFPYNISVRGQNVTNLRLSGQTLAKIFTNQITNWSDPAITADNNGQALPSIPIVPLCTPRDPEPRTSSPRTLYTTSRHLGKLLGH